MNFNDAIAALDQLYEAKRVIHDVDVLYHFTNPTPFLKIFSNDTLRADVNLKAVCLTTDRNYRIYGYPCGIQFSRKKLLDDGYEIVPFDEFADDPEAAGESEERIYKNIEQLSKYVTAVHIYWQGSRDDAEIAIARSSQGPRICDAVYDERGNENESYDLMLKDFTDLLSTLKSKGIKVLEYGTPHAGYYLTDNGRLEYLDGLEAVEVAAG
jgi:hypothetical protein